MSLDVYLHADAPCPHCGKPIADGVVFERNITHNLNKMAAAAGIYEACWRPDEHGIETAAQVATVLRPGLELLLANPERFKELNPSNGWGSYEGLVDFANEYLVACDAYPTAIVRVSR